MKLTKEKLQQIIKEELESISEDKEKNERAKRLSNYESLFKVIDVLDNRGQLQDLMKLKDDAKEAEKKPGPEQNSNERFEALAAVQGKVEELIEDIIGSGGVKNVAAGITRNEGRFAFDDLGSLMKMKQEYKELKAQGYPEKAKPRKPLTPADTDVYGKLD
jgi:hypothetical protein